MFAANIMPAFLLGDLFEWKRANGWWIEEGGGDLGYSCLVNFETLAHNLRLVKGV